MDKTQYDEKILKLTKEFEEGDYERFHGHPLNHMVNVAKETIHHMIGELKLGQLHQFPKFVIQEFLKCIDYQNSMKNKIKILWSCVKNSRM
jgi:hypothetical protein